MALAQNARLQFELGDQIKVFSDKSYRRQQNTIFEAVGNVVIISQKETLYGEAATFDTEKLFIKLEGNVRYVSEGVTLFGSEIQFDLQKDSVLVENGRILTDSFLVLGKSLERIDPKTFVAKEAEYTTCRDCPESWSVYGGDVKIVVDEYIYIQNALIKVNGIVVLFLPYLVLPIKKQRQTGLLFPHFQISLNRGVWYQQPWFWAINPSTDLTLTPSIFGERGLGGELEARKVFGDQKWMEIDSIGVSDRIYLPGKDSGEPSGVHYFRHFTNFEQNLQFGHSVYHHFNYAALRDFDTVNDYSMFTDGYGSGLDAGAEGHLEYRNNHLVLGAEMAQTQNFVFSEATKADPSYVQVMPEIYFDLTPISLIKSNIPGMQSITFSSRNRYSSFRQDDRQRCAPGADCSFIRNADRLMLAPDILWNFGQLGPVNFQTQYNFEYYAYKFPYLENENRNFSKYASFLESEVSFEVEKKFGLAFHEDLEVKFMSSEEKTKFADKIDETAAPVDQNLIGHLDEFSEEATKNIFRRQHNAYRHKQKVAFKHYLTTRQHTTGNKRFLEQIQQTGGLFDPNDTLKTRENDLGTVATRTLISPKNTVEFQWNHSLVRKQSRGYDLYRDQKYLQDNFNYQQVGFFNVSQGLELNTDNENLKDDLTRLHIRSGIGFAKWSFSVDEYYFYQGSNHILSTTMMRQFDFAQISLGYRRNSFSNAAANVINGRVISQVLPTVRIDAAYTYDIRAKENIESTYGLEYAPTNNCWRLNAIYQKNVIDNRFSINFAVNFSDNRFTTFGGNDGQQ